MPREYTVHRQCTDPHHPTEMPRVVPADQPLVVKRVEWRMAGKPRNGGGGMVRSRTVMYQCETCLTRDPDFNQEAYQGVAGAR